jgi:hypothetical protein
LRAPVHEQQGNHGSSGKVLNVAGASTADGANVDQWSWANVNQQMFQIVAVP